MNRFGACLVATLLTSCQTADDPRVASVAAQPSCSSSPSARDEVADTVRAFFEALARDDDTEVGRLTTPDFHAFDVGRRFTGPELSRLIADAHRSGRILQWNIGPVDTQVDCNSAFAFWENVGASGTASRLEPRTWLESAYLVRRNGRWAIRFLHSTPKDPRY